MKFYKLPLILALISLTLIVGCKNDDDETTNDSKEKLLTGGSSKNWKVTEIKGSSKNPTLSYLSVDIYNSKVYAFGIEVPSGQYDIPKFPDCAKDNIITFKSDKTYQVNEGATTCTEDYLFELTQGTWALSSDETSLTLNDNSGLTIKYDLTELTQQTMKGENSGQFEYDGDNIDYTIKTTFTAQ